MGTFFKPLRRKTGVVTLVLACWFMVGWIRSRTSEDILEMRTSHHTTHRFSSSKNKLTWDKIDDYEPEIFVFPTARLDWFSFRTKLISPPSDGSDDPYVDQIGRWHFQIWGIDFGPKGYGKIAIMTFGIPYRFFVIPLTLLSAWLLLSKPRAGKVA